jgi:methyl-accepting chemotaxis protein
MNMIVALLVISAVLNVVLIYSSYVVVKKIEIYEDNIMKFYTGAIKILRAARHLDNREMFEKDDEVGTLFDQLIEVIGELRGIIYETEEEEA